MLKNKYILNIEFKNPKIITNEIDPIQTTQPKSQQKIVNNQNQLFQPLEKNEKEQPVFYSNQSFQKKNKSLFIIIGGFICFFIIIIAFKYLKRFDNDITQNNIQPTQAKQQINQENKRTNIQSSNSGKYLQASERFLTSEDVMKLNKYELKIMRNEIFARHGYIFKTDDMKAYFESQSWYVPQYNDVTSLLTEIEKRNIEFIKNYE